MTLQEAISNVNNELSTEPKKEKVSVSYNCPKLKTGSSIVDVRVVVAEYDEDGELTFRSKSTSIIKVDLRKVTKIPSERELESDFSTQYFKDNADSMSLQQREYAKIKKYCVAAIEVNRAERIEKLRCRATIFGDVEIHKCALSIHELCEWIEDIEDVDQLRADEAQDIQQAAARLEFIMERLGYGATSFNTEKYKNDSIAQKVHATYAVFKGQNDETKIARFKNCDESLIDPLPESATRATVSTVRQVYEDACGRPVSDSPKRGKKSTTSP
ncbi:hypothetical protein [Vibrio sp. F74]|uniref:hypothetical protein n=1 Tax=Vibrio sp. F74 TaxID=700020 RepID=UPI0035F591E2